MKKSLLFLAAAAAVSMSAFAQTDLTEGTEYYIRNVKTGMFLAGGYGWSTNLIIKPQGRAFELYGGDGYGAYKMRSSCGDVKSDNGYYVDGGAGSSPEFFIEAYNGHYTIDLDGGMLKPNDDMMTYGDAFDAGIITDSWESWLQSIHSYDFYTLTTTPSLDDEAILWDFMTREDLIAELKANASEENPMEATFLIKAHNVDREDEAASRAAWVINPDMPELADKDEGLKYANINWGYYKDLENEWAVADTYFFYNYDDAEEDLTVTVGQEATGAPAGLYEVKYRVVNQITTPFSLTFNETQADVVEHEYDLWYGSTTGYFADRSQVKTARFEVGEDGKLAIKMTKDVKAATQSRFAFKNFILTYLGSEEEGSGVETVATDAADAPAEYFNLQGIRVAEPTNGIYIVKQGNKVSKQVVR